MSNDIALNPVSLPSVGKIYGKPAHLITLTKGKGQDYFIAMDKPELLIGFVSCKGFYYDSFSSKDDLTKLISDTPKEQIVELLIPTHRILEIKNLAFKAK